MERKLEPQPHGGALARDGSPGNRGGGRPKDKVRALALQGTQAAVKGIMRLLEQAESGDVKLTPSDLNKMAATLGSLSIGTRHEVEQRVVDPEIVSKAVNIAESMGVDREKYREALLAELDGIKEWDGLELYEGTG